MEEQRFDKLLKQLQKRPIPSLPSTLSQNVWREIRNRPSGQKTWVDFLPHFIFSPRILSAGLAIAFVVGMGSGIVMTALSQSHAVPEALNLQVFLSSPPDMPSTILTQSL